MKTFPMMAIFLSKRQKSSRNKKLLPSTKRKSGEKKEKAVSLNLHHDKYTAYLLSIIFDTNKIL